MQAVIQPETSTLASHPFLNLAEQKISLAGYQRKIETSKLLPDLSVRYFNQKWYGKNPGYYGYSFGVGIPLFFWSQQGKIQSAKLQQQIAQKQFENNQLQLNTGYKQAVQEYQKNLLSLNYYETTSLGQSDELLNAATEAYKAGEIGYLEYNALLSQSLDIKNSYLDALNNFNQAVIQINFFTNK
jgi:cobalt-zinc-cadmium resistance protein CzcA